MARRKGLVLDANILLRAVFGKRVRELLEAFEDAVTFYSPDVCFDDARKYIPDVSSRRRIDSLHGLAVLEEVSNIISPRTCREMLAASLETPATFKRCGESSHRFDDVENAEAYGKR